MNRQDDLYESQNKMRITLRAKCQYEIRTNVRNLPKLLLLAVVIVLEERDKKYKKKE